MTTRDLLLRFQRLDALPRPTAEQEAEKARLLKELHRRMDHAAD